MRTVLRFRPPKCAVFAPAEESPADGPPAIASSAPERDRSCQARRAHAWARARTAWFLQEAPSSSRTAYALQPPPARRMRAPESDLAPRSSPALPEARRTAPGDWIRNTSSYDNSPTPVAFLPSHLGHSTALSAPTEATVVRVRVGSVRSVSMSPERTRADNQAPGPSRRLIGSSLGPLAP